MRPSVVWLCLPLLAACPGDDGPATPTTTTDATAASNTTASDTTASPATDSTTETTAPPDTETAPPDTDTDTDTNGTLPGCECIPDDDPGVDTTAAPSLPACGEPTCPGVSLVCEGSCGDGLPMELDDPAALECALTALRDRTPGHVTWTLSEHTGQFDDAGYVLVNADGTAVRRNWGWQDLTYEVTDAVLGELPPPEDFDACLADPDDVARFICLRSTLQSMQGVCDDGWYYSKA